MSSRLERTAEIGDQLQKIDYLNRTQPMPEWPALRAELDAEARALVAAEHAERAKEPPPPKRIRKRKRT